MNSKISLKKMIEEKMENLNIVRHEEDNSEKGASMLEYALLAALIAVVAIASITFLGQSASTTFSNVGQTMTDSNTQFVG